MREDVVQRTENEHDYYRVSMTVVIALGVVTAAGAQQVDAQFTLQSWRRHDVSVDVIESVPLESVTSVPNAPFSQTPRLSSRKFSVMAIASSGRYTSTIASDSQGRTRREEEIALVGPLAVNGPSPRLVTIVDTVAGLSYTLDERQRIAFRNPMALTKLHEAHFYVGAAKGAATGCGAADGRATWEAGGKAKVAIAGVPGQRVVVGDKAASKITTEALGTRSIEGVTAEGTRTTSTIAAGAIGNVMPIEVVTERWYSRELQMAVLISRQDPRSGRVDLSAAQHRAGRSHRRICSRSGRTIRYEAVNSAASGS